MFVVFVCTAMNHLGLVGAVEDVIRRKLPIINCPKCSSFWFTVITCVLHGLSPFATLATSFLASYSSIWLELLMGAADVMYIKAYEKIYPTANDNEDTSVADNGSAAS